MEFGIADLYDEDRRAAGHRDEPLEQADETDGDVTPKRRGRKSSKASYAKRQTKKVDTRPADVAAESDY